MVDAAIEDQVSKFREDRFMKAGEIFSRLTHSPEFPEFLTLAAYEYID